MPAEHAHILQYSSCPYLQDINIHIKYEAVWIWNTTENLTENTGNDFGRGIVGLISSPSFRMIGRIFEEDRVRGMPFFLVFLLP